MTHAARRERRQAALGRRSMSPRAGPRSPAGGVVEPELAPSEARRRRPVPRAGPSGRALPSGDQDGAAVGAGGLDVRAARLHRGSRGGRSDNGVAVAARHPIADVQASGGLGDEHLDREPRIIACLVDTPVPVRVASVYVPHGRRRPLALRLQAGFPRRPGRAGPAVAARRCASARRGRRERGGVGRRRVPPGCVHRFGVRDAAVRDALARMLDAGLVDLDVARWGPRAGRFTWWDLGLGVCAQPGYASRRHRGRSGAGGLGWTRRGSTTSSGRCRGRRITLRWWPTSISPRVEPTVPAHHRDASARPVLWGAGHLVTAGGGKRLSEFVGRVGDDRRQDAGARTRSAQKHTPPAAVASTATAEAAARAAGSSATSLASSSPSVGRTCQRPNTALRDQGRPRLIGAAVERSEQCAAKRDLLEQHGAERDPDERVVGDRSGGRRRTRASSRSGCSAGPPMRRPARRPRPPRDRPTPTRTRPPGGHGAARGPRPRVRSGGRRR